MLIHLAVLISYLIFICYVLPLPTSAVGTCIQKCVIERYVCLIVFMVITQTHVQAVSTVH